MTPTADIIAVAARTPIGLDAASSATAAGAAVSAIAEHPYLIDESGDPLRGAMDPELASESVGWERMAALCAEPLLELGRALEAPGRPTLPARILLALPENRPGWSPDDARALFDALASREIPGMGSLQLTVCGQGHAGALQGLGIATQNHSSGSPELCIVGGVDSYFHADTIAWLSAHRQLVTKDTRSSFFPGEAASFVAVADDRTRTILGLPSMARIRGAHTATERERIKTDCNNLGFGLSEAIDGAASDLGSPEELVDTVLCDLNGERYRTEEWGFAALRTQQLFRDPTAYEAPSSLWGDVGAASGVLFATLAVQQWIRGTAKGPLAMLFAGSESGARSALVLEQSAAERA